MQGCAPHLTACTSCKLLHPPDPTSHPHPPAVVGVQLILHALRCIVAADSIQAQLRAPHIQVGGREGLQVALPDLPNHPPGAPHNTSSSSAHIREQAYAHT
jgi:hypothetical protein